MNRRKCLQCGLVNLAADETCRRCGASLIEEQSAAIREEQMAVEPAEETVPRRSIVQRLAWILGTTLILVFAAYMSLLLTSEDLPIDQRHTVKNAIAILRQKGFERQAFVLDNLVKYRSTDSWWNRYVGHHDAYAATNFPFEVVTEAPKLFTCGTDGHSDCFQ